MKEVVSTAFHYTELSSKNLKNVIAPNRLRIKTNKQKNNETEQPKNFHQISFSAELLIHPAFYWKPLRTKFTFFVCEESNYNFSISHSIEIFSTIVIQLLDHLFWGFHSLSWQSLITFSEYKKKKGFQHRLRTGLLTSDV